jgi:nucleoside-diphosphate-sugar epimerase
MRVFVAGAAGAIGRQLVPLLLEAGHEVAGTTRSAERAAWLGGQGARAVIVDALDADALRAAVVDARPRVVIHQLTDLAAGYGDKQLRANARLRRLGTRYLMDAALVAGASRMVAQSGAWLYAPGPEPHGEGDPLIDLTDVPDHPVLPGIIELERIVTTTPRVDGLVLRYGFLYGPGTEGTDPGDGPTVHVVAAADAAARAVERGSPGIYNVVDDGGSVSNARARQELGWQPSKR